MRNQQAKQHLEDFTATLEEEDENFSYCGESYYQESETEGLQTLQEEISENRGSANRLGEKFLNPNASVSESLDVAQQRASFKKMRPDTELEQRRHSNNTSLANLQASKDEGKILSKGRRDSAVSANVSPGKRGRVDSSQDKSMSDISQLGGHLFHSTNKGKKDSVNNISMEIDRKSVTNESAKTDKYTEYKDHPAIPALPQSAVYDVIIDTVYSQEKSPLQWPQTLGNRILYLI